VQGADGAPGETPELQMHGSVGCWNRNVGVVDCSQRPRIDLFARFQHFDLPMIFE
jgi:hypothetical protein